MAVDNFRGHIWNQHIFLVIIRDFEKNQRTLTITTHPPTYPDNKGFRRFEKGRFTLVFLKPPFSFTNAI